MATEPAVLVEILVGRSIPLPVAGAKAASLDRLIAAGYSVPRSAVVTTTAYQRFVESGPMAGFLAALRSEPIPAPEFHGGERDRIDAAFLDAPMAPDVVAAVAEAVHAVRSDLVSLRSSATAEDLESASFAGQYRSFLDVDASSVERAVRLVWASLWHPAPRLYRQVRRIPDDAMSMAVLVMEMVHPDTAGVLFTADPAGSAGDVRIEIVEGLGESLVSGFATPEIVVAPRSEAADRFAKLGSPYGVLTREALRLERELGAPQDIEWAIVRDRVWFLQARPITSRPADAAGTDAEFDDGFDDGFDVHHDLSSRFTTAGIDEMLPGILPPLCWEAASWMLEDGFRGLFAALGADVAHLDAPHALLGRVRGRAALDLDRMRAVADSLPGGSSDELETRYFGRPLSPDPVAGGPGRLRSAPRGAAASAWSGARLLRLRQVAVLESHVVVRAVEEVLDVEPELGSREDVELRAYRHRLRDLAARTAAAEVAVAALATAAYRGVETFLEGHLSAGASAAAQDLVRRTRTPTADHAALDLDPTRRALGASDELRTIADLEWPAAEAALQSTERGRIVLETWRDAKRRAGSTASYGGETWEERPELAWLALQARIGRAAPDEEGSPDDPLEPASSRRCRGSGPPGIPTP